MHKPPPTTVNLSTTIKNPFPRITNIVKLGSTFPPPLTTTLHVRCFGVFYIRTKTIIVCYILLCYRYAKNAKRLSALYRDRDRDPLEKAVYWVEYVARHRVDLMLKPATRQHWWYERCLLDVVAAVVVTVAGTAYLAKRVLAKVLSAADTVRP